MKNRYRVVISPEAEKSLKEIYSYIEKQSPSAAKFVSKNLVVKAKGLSKMPERFSREEFLLEREGNYRSVSQWQYKIVYRVQENDVLILNFFHTRRDPEEIRKL